ncbi:MAG TPA: hypothetical protein VNR42_10740 [Solirubrobacteraceae bacterium]|nr:hypothetical protein [Solirubrobacteraceae bacterium]
MSEQRQNPETDLIERLHAIDVRAPEELHRRVQSLVAERTTGSRVRGGVGGRTRWPLLLGGAGTTVAAAAVILVLILAGGGSSKLSVREVSARTLLAATTAAPRESPRERGALTENVDGVAFPYWKGRFGWRASGTRSDTIDGRTVRTVFYSDTSGQRIGYAIVSGTPAPAAHGGVVVWRHGKPYRLLSEHGVTSVVWMRSGRLCVVTGRGVSSSMLLALASWRERGSAV